MRKFFIIIPLLLIGFASPAHSQDHGFGIGGILGDPTGISAKYWTSDNNALDVGLGYSFLGVSSGFLIHLDYIYHIKNLVQSEEEVLFYYGFGIRFRFPNNEANIFGARGVAGILWYPQILPVDLFVEAAPSFRLFPNAAIDFSFGIGGRYFFTISSEN